MPTPMEICLEDLDLSPDDERYVRCVALPGGEPGLALDREGAVRWMPEDPAPFGLWVSADDRLVLLRSEGAGPITVERGGRSLDAPAEKPVFLLDGDLLRLNGRSLQLHVHGVTEAVQPPERLTAAALGRVARAAATALALGAAVGVAGSAAAGPATPSLGGAPIEVRAQPPKKVALRPVKCDIRRMNKNKQGKLVVHATCPAGTMIYQGSRGVFLDPRTGDPIANATVVVKSIDKQGKLVGESELKRKPKAKQLRFMARH